MKRQKYLAKLSSDHHLGLRIAKLLKSAKDASTADLENIKSKLTPFFKDELMNHFEEEESLLAPPLKDNPLILKMLDDHNRMNDLFNSIIRADGNDLQAKLETLGVLLESHIRFEERELFPMIEQTLSKESLEEIWKQLKKIKGAN